MTTDDLIWRVPAGGGMPPHLSHGWAATALDGVAVGERCVMTGAPGCLTCTRLAVEELARELERRETVPRP
jgi:hypothetical protein